MNTKTLALLSSSFLALSACGTSLLGSGNDPGHSHSSGFGGSGAGGGSSNGSAGFGGGSNSAYGSSGFGGGSNGSSGFGGGSNGSAGFGGGSNGSSGFGGGSSSSGIVEPTDAGIVGVDPPLPSACARTGVDPGTADANALGHLMYGFAAHWTGIATSTRYSPFAVDMTFRPDSTYSAHCISGGKCSAFVGSRDLDAPGKRYEMNEIETNGEGLGNIDVLGADGMYVNYVLMNITVSSDLTTAAFDLGDGVNPTVLHYSLRCTN